MDFRTVNGKASAEFNAREKRKMDGFYEVFGTVSQSSVFSERARELVTEVSKFVTEIQAGIDFPATAKGK